MNQPDREPEELAHSCVLDLADRGGLMLDDVGALLNLTRERVRQIAEKTLRKLRRGAGGRFLAVLVED